MANYHYDEGGSMATYFVLTFLALGLVPLSFSLPGSNKKRNLPACECKECVDQRTRNKRRQGSLPTLSIKTIIVVVGWAVFAVLAYRVAGQKITSTVYDPYEILGLRMGISEKDIKSHFKKLSKKFHPDKVRPSGNETIESIEAHFVDLTKAYKSLTDPVIRENLEQYGHPDGRREVTTGIALPAWVVASQNNIWVLGLYAVIFGGLLPMMVGRWWFGNRELTKDGVRARTAAAFWHTISEESGMRDALKALGRGLEFEHPKALKVNKAAEDELKALEAKVKGEKKEEWLAFAKLVEGGNEGRRRALLLLYAHLLRIPLNTPALQTEQAQVLLATPLLLSALLQISAARSWLSPALATMRLHAHLAQALAPSAPAIAQLPGMKVDEEGAETVDDAVWALARSNDARVGEVKKAAQRWGKLELVDLAFKVIDETFVVPSSIVFLVVKLRLVEPGARKPDLPKPDAARDERFLTSRGEAEELPAGKRDAVGYAHAPYWPSNRRPAWWLVLADDKSNKIVVPPIRITDVPACGDYRAYKLQFQAPQNVGLFTWRVYVVSDTFVGEEVVKDLALKIDDPSVLATAPAEEDEISEPDEDTVAGQMAAMRGHAVKRRAEESDEEDDESGTDDDEESDSSSSDSD